MTLGDLIRELERWPSDFLVTFNPLNGEPVGYPTELMSWRGVYAQLSFEIGQVADENPTVQKLLAECREAVGKTFQGYKGGDFTMDESTPVWISGYGEARHIAILRLRRDTSVPKLLLMDIADIQEYWF